VADIVVYAVLFRAAKQPSQQPTMELDA